MFFDICKSKAKDMKVAYVLRLLKNDGWELRRTKGSLGSILKQAGLK